MSTKVMVDIDGVPAEYKVDFTPVLVPGVKFAIKCKTRLDAEIFLTAMLEAYPKKTRTWSASHTCWTELYAKERGGMAYFPDVNNVENSYLCYGSVEWALDNGYTVVLFDDLLARDEPLSDGGHCIDDLFGLMGVGA